MTEIHVVKPGPARKSDHLIYISVLDRDPMWIAASAKLAAISPGSRLKSTTALLLAGAVFLGGMSVGGYLALTIGAESRARKGTPDIWMFPYPAIGGPVRLGGQHIPTSSSGETVSEPIESPEEPFGPVKMPNPGSRLRGKSG